MKLKTSRLLIIFCFFVVNPVLFDMRRNEPSGAGFLGQHLVKELHNYNGNITEIRILDLQPYINKLGHRERKLVKIYIGDISLMNGECLDAFKDVSTVFHCAAFISYEFPSNVEKFEANNVEGTKNVIRQCLKNNVRSLIYTSTAEVCMKPYFKNGFFTVIANQSESKILPPVDRNQLIFGSYAESKLIGEELVLEADNKKHDSGEGTLRTIALRPTFMYGEEDTTLIPTIIKFSIKLNHKICRFGGSGGRHQFVYAGNVAWAHICALKTLNENADSIAGLPMFVTDDSNVSDLLFFCKRLCTPQTEKSKTLSPTSWYIPTLISFIFFTIFEIIYKYLCKAVPLLHRLPISPKAFVIYLGSVIFFSSLRAILYLDYNPIYEKNDALVRSNLYYTKLFKTISESNDKKLINNK